MSFFFVETKGQRKKGAAVAFNKAAVAGPIFAASS